MTFSPFQQRVYTLLKQIPSGRVSSYAALFRALSSSPRAVTEALKRNPFAPEVPCHRIICADGNIGGKRKIDQAEKLRLLKSEGVLFDAKGKLVDEKRWWDDIKVWYGGVMPRLIYLKGKRNT